MSQLSTHRSFWRHLLRAFPVFVIVTLITLALEYVGWLRGFETTTLDTWLRLQKPIKPKFVCVVAINEDDYLHIFGAKSPLDPKTVMTLISAIADGKPAVVGVDVDTSDAQWQSIVPELQPLSQGRTAIVWEQEAIGQGEPLTPVNVLGGAEITPKPLSGVSGLFQDWDGVVRRSRRYFSTTGAREGQIENRRFFLLGYCQSLLPNIPQSKSTSFPAAGGYPKRKP